MDLVLGFGTMHVVLFDIDGTLVDSMDFDSRLYIESVAAVTGVGISGDWTQFEHATDSGIIDEVLRSNGFERNRNSLRAAVEADFSARVDAYLRDRDGVLPEIPGARRFVAELISHPGVAVGFATGGWKKTALMKLKAIGLDPDPSTLATASDAISRVNIMSLCERRVTRGHSSSRRTYFGDASWDKDACARLNFDFIAIGGRVDHRPRFADFSQTRKIMTRLGLDLAGEH